MLSSNRPRARIALLGPFRMEVDGEALDVGAWSARPRRLLTLLAASPSERRTREEVMDLLWPDATPSAAASNLRHTLHLLRRAVEVDPPPVISRSGWVSLSPSWDWEVDIERFDFLVGPFIGRPLQASAEPARPVLEEAAALYRGEALSDERYSEWAAPVRDRAGRLWREVCLRLACLNLEDHPHIAGWWAERYLASEPLDEEAVQLQLRSLTLSGRPDEALRVYRSFESRLKAELDAVPSEETRTLGRRSGVRLARTRSTDLEVDPAGGADQALPVVVPTHPGLSGRRLVGREAELEQIAELLQGGGGAPAPDLVLVSAEAGMGKTSLLSEAGRRARERGALTLGGAAFQHEGRLPYGPVHDAFLDLIQGITVDRGPSDLIRGLTALLPILPEVRHLPEARSRGDAGNLNEQGESGRLQLFSAIVQLLDVLRSAASVLLLLDDLQWADDATLQLLQYLLRQRPATDRNGRNRLGRAHPLVIVASYRTEELGGPLEAFVVEARKRLGSQVHERELQLVTRVELAQILGEELGREPPVEVVEAIAQRSGGNPFFALQMLHLVAGEQDPERRPSGPLTVPAGRLRLPAAVRDAVAQRMQRVERDATEALTLGAVQGEVFEYAAIAAVWEGSESLLFSALDSCVEAGILHETESGYRFAHPLLREVAYEEVPAGRRPVLHARTALALETLHVRDHDTHAAGLAFHFSRAGSQHRESTLRYLSLAGGVAARSYAWAAAEEHYQEALDLVTDGGGRAELSERLARVLANQTRRTESIELLQEAEDWYRQNDDVEGTIRCAARFGAVCSSMNQPERGLAHLEPFRPLLSQISAPSQVRAAICFCQILFDMGRYADALAETGRARAVVGSAAGDEPLATEIEVRHGTNLLALGRIQEGLAVLEAVMPRVEAVDDADLLSRALNSSSYAYSVLGRTEKTLACRERALEAAERAGESSAIEMQMCALGQVLLNLRDWTAARELFERAAALSETHEVSQLSADAQYFLGVIAEFTRGEEEARPLWERFRQAAPAAHLAWVEQFALDVALIDDSVVRRFDPPGLESLAASTAQPEAWQAFLGCAWLNLEHPEKAWQIVTSLLAWGDEKEVGDIRGAALHLLGCLHAREGRWDEAASELEQAASLLRDFHHVVYLLILLMRMGRLYVKAGMMEKARPYLEEARELFQEIGAKRFLPAVEELIAQSAAPVA